MIRKMSEEEKKSESIPPEAKGFVARVKSMATLLTAMAALVAGLGAMFKPQDQTATKSSYEELRTSVKELAKAADDNHDDLMALRAYLDGYANATKGVTLPAPTVSPPTPTAGASTVGAATSSSSTPVVALLRPPPPVPQIHPKQPVREPADFAKLKK
jgi:hypothetical protein